MLSPLIPYRASECLNPNPKHHPDVRYCSNLRQDGGLTMNTRFDLCGDSSGNYDPPICPDRRTSVVVIGGGVAGVWVAYQLIKARIDTTLITYQAEDRGGV